MLSFLVTGCGYNPDNQPSQWLELRTLPLAEGRELALCVDFDCTKNQRYTFSSSDLQKIRATFEPSAETPQDERKQISLAIGLLETQVGTTIGTLHDQPENNFPDIPNTRQLDCIAESLNTTQFLLFLERENLLSFHRIGGNAHRGPLTLNAPHNSASIIENKSGKAFAVDSWFGHNGDPAWVTPIEHWLTGESPEQPYR